MNTGLNAQTESLSHSTDQWNNNSTWIGRDSNNLEQLEPVSPDCHQDVNRALSATPNSFYSSCTDLSYTEGTSSLENTLGKENFVH